MVVYVDIDETICNTGDDRDYSKAEPIVENIDAVNELFSEGHTIVYWTARGAQTGIDWTEVTTVQLEKWGAKHHEVKLGKPHYDLFICDKAINTNRFFNHWREE
jgi:hypothetical protein